MGYQYLQGGCTSERTLPDGVGGKGGDPIWGVSRTAPPGSDSELAGNKTETDCPGAWWFSVSDFPLRQLSMYIEQMLRKE